VLLPVDVVPHGLYGSGRRTYRNDSSGDLPGNYRATAYNRTGADPRAWQENATRAKKAIIGHVNSAVEIGAGVLVARNPHPPVMCNEVYIMTDCYLIPDRNQIWLAAEGGQVCAIDLYTLSYLSSMTPEVPDRIPVKPYVIYGQHQDPMDHG
jgi:hypothetical protein